MRIDIAPSDLLWALGQCATARVPTESLGDWMVTRSVRSAFDLYLSSLALPPGSEVVMTGLTVPDMWRLVRLHQLVPVPVDLEPDTLAPTREALDDAISEKTRLIVVAHLFGGRIDLTAVREVARRHELPIVEDLAQAFVGPESQGHPASALWLFSFGSIKTATALGGALVRVREPAIARRMEELHSSWPIQPTGAFARKVSTFLLLAGVRGPHRFNALARGCELTSRSLDELLRQVTRGFPSADDAFVATLRTQPSEPMRALLRRRIERFDHQRLEQRAAAGEWLRDRVGCVGAKLEGRTHWLYAVSDEAPDELVHLLRAEGFDGARGTSTINAVPGRTPRLSRLLERIVFVPAYPEIPTRDRERLARLLERRH